MNAMRWRVVLFVAVLAAVAPGLQAQQRATSPHLGYAYPAGGRQGGVVDVTVGGQFLTGATAVYLSGQGLTADAPVHHRPMTPQEALALRDKLEAARKKLQDEGLGIGFGRGLGDPAVLQMLAREAGVSDEELRRLREFQRMRTDPKRQLNPQLAETLTFRITIDPNAAAGRRELRVLTPLGLSNPIRFCVGCVREYVETEPNDVLPDTGIGDDLPVVVNGQIMPGDVDRFSFTAHKGARLVITAEAQQLMPYLADAVPGWFQVALTLTDAKGREIAYADHYRFMPDPVLTYRVPADGTYVLEVRDSLYRGREDFVYRVTIGELPLLTGVFPLGGRAGSVTTVAATGWNLPKPRFAVDGRGKEPGTSLVADGDARGLPFALNTLPEVPEREPNDRVAHAQRVTLPVIVNGRIGHPGDEDVFRLVGHAGQKIVAEVYARRLGSPVDSVLTLTDRIGKQLAANDDTEDKGAGLVTHQADSYLAVTLPASGPYFLRIRDAQHKGGPEYAYRLRISRPRPDFELRVVPSSITVRAGLSAPVTVYALRRDGFAGEITLDLKDAPPGFALSGARLPANADQVRFTVSLPPTQSREPVTLQLEGQTVIGGRVMRRPAVPADDMMQAFAYRHLVPADDWVVASVGRVWLGPAIRLADPAPVKLPAGGTARVVLSGLRPAVADRLQLALSEPPEGVGIQSMATGPDGLVIVLRADAKKAKPGLQGNLIVEATREAPAPVRAGNRLVARRRFSLGTLPAIPFEIVAR